MTCTTISPDSNCCDDPKQEIWQEETTPIDLRESGTAYRVAFLQIASEPTLQYCREPLKRAL